MILNTIVAGIMIVATTVIHASSMILIIKVVRPKEKYLRNCLPLKQIIWIAGTVLFLYFVSLIEAAVWAAAYLALNAIEGFEKALYFSTVTFTTLGYGDIIFQENWRLLASFEAANGIIMFGWTTAIVVAVVRHIFFD